jgi:hypothetical protein
MVATAAKIDKHHIDIFLRLALGVALIRFL